MRLRKLIATALLIAGTGFTFQAYSQNASQQKPSGQIGPGAQYCKDTGGIMEERYAVYGTNNPKGAWLQLSGGELFCQYTASDGSRIHLAIHTLYTTLPSLATLAYYSQTPWNGQGNGNPASFYCTQLGGAEIGATDAAGGGWVTNNPHDIDQVLETCIFPDNSTIDSWGLFYHSNNIIRGIDLSTVLRYANPNNAKKQ